jgi:hypothetical protein
VCNYHRCAFCGKVKLGLLMAWETPGTTTKLTGHVCYGCEDTICTRLSMGLRDVRWLDTLEGCK